MAYRQQDTRQAFSVCKALTQILLASIFLLQWACTRDKRLGGQDTDLRQVDAEKAYREVARTLDLFMPKLMKAVSGHQLHCEVRFEPGIWESEQVEPAIEVLQELQGTDAVNEAGASILCTQRLGHKIDDVLDGSYFQLQAPPSFVSHGPSFKVDGRTINFGDFTGINGIRERGIRVTSTAAADDGEFELEVWRWIPKNKGAF